MKLNPKIALATGVVEPCEDGTFYIIFKKADNTPSKKNEAALRFTPQALAELLKSGQSAMLNKFIEPKNEGKV